MTTMKIEQTYTLVVNDTSIHLHERELESLAYRLHHWVQEKRQRESMATALVKLGRGAAYSEPAGLNPVEFEALRRRGALHGEIPEFSPERFAGYQVDPRSGGVAAMQVQPDFRLLPIAQWSTERRPEPPRGGWPEADPTWVLDTPRLDEDVLYVGHAPVAGAAQVAPAAPTVEPPTPKE